MSFERGLSSFRARLFGFINPSQKGAQLSQGVRLHDFLTRPGNKPTRFSGIDVDYMRDAVTGWVDQIQKGYCFRSRAPREHTLSVSAQQLKLILPAHNSCTESYAEGPA
jgi:hypothetical protein